MKNEKNEKTETVKTMLLETVKPELILPVIEKKKKTVFDSGLKEIHKCSEVISPIIILAIMVIRKIQLLLIAYPTTEWGASLIGTNEKGVISITDLNVFNQNVTSVTINAIHEGKGSVGIIHSHHNMGSFFSGTDNEGGNQNNDVSIVVAHKADSPLKFELLATVRVKTPCGGYARFDKVLWEIDTCKADGFDDKEFIATAKENIKEEKFYPVSRYGGEDTFDEYVRNRDMYYKQHPKIKVTEDEYYEDDFTNGKYNWDITKPHGIKDYNSETDKLVQCDACMCQFWEDEVIIVTECNRELHLCEECYDKYYDTDEPKIEKTDIEEIF